MIKPISAPNNITIRKTSAIGKGSSPGNILPAYPELCKSAAQTQATSPTMRPAERSVPVRMIAPAIPRARGKLAAESENQT